MSKKAKKIISKITAVLTVLTMLTTVFMGINSSAAGSTVKNDLWRPILIEDGKNIKIYDALGKKLGQVLKSELQTSWGTQNGYEGGYAVLCDSKRNYYIADTSGKKIYKAPEKCSLKKVGRDAFEYFDDNASKHNRRLINHTGKVLVSAGKYKYFKEDTYANQYSKSVYIVVESANGKYGLITEKGEEVLKPIYKSIEIYQGVKDVGIIKADGKYYVCIDGKKAIVLSSASEISITNYQGDVDCKFVQVGKNEAYYMIKDGKLFNIGNYEYAQNIGYRYIFVDTLDNYGKAIYDTQTKKILGKLEKVDFSKFEEIPVILHNGSQASDVVTPFYSKHYECVTAGLLGSGYYYTEDFKSEEPWYYNIYNSKGEKILSTKGIYVRFGAKDNSGRPKAAVQSSDGIAFVCGSANDSSTGLQLIDKSGKIILSGKNISDMSVIGKTVVVKYTDGLTKAYRPNGKEILKNIKDIEGIDYKEKQYVNYAVSPQNYWCRVNINGKYGLYDFNNYKYIIQPTLSSLNRLTDDLYYKGKDGNNKDIYFSWTGVQLK